MTFLLVAPILIAVVYVVLVYVRASREAKQRQLIERRARAYGDLYVTLLEIESLPEREERVA